MAGFCLFCNLQPFERHWRTSPAPVGDACVPYRAAPKHPVFYFDTNSCCQESIVLICYSRPFSQPINGAHVFYVFERITFRVLLMLLI